MEYSDKELDDFWDVEKLVPKKKKIISPFSSEPRTVTYTVDGEEDKNEDDRKLSFEALKGVGESKDESYTNEGCGLVKRVTIKRFIDKYDFYGAFRKAALLYYDYKTGECPFAPFYSYMPQYSQLGTEQKNYYFYWRDCVRRGKYPRSDYSYLYLYIYEILNLPDKIPPSEGILLICKLWQEYRQALPRIDSYFALWVQDYCLVYDLPCPTEQLRDFLSEAVAVSDFKEFYLSEIDKTDVGTEAMLAYLSDYDWHRGRYAGGEYAELYRKHMISAMWRLLYRLDLTGSAARAKTDIIRRDAFAHSLCTHAVKCKLEVEYVKLSDNEDLRQLVSSGVRYTENKLRALFGIKSRLSVKALPEEYKHIIDLYFSGIFSEEKKRREREDIPEYEKLYDAPREKLSFDGADEIERASWSTTARLVEEIEEIEETYTEEKSETELEASEPDSDESDCYGLSREDISLLLAVLKYGRTLDGSAAERINEAFADGFGDIILESDGESYRIIEDYEEDVSEWLLKIMK